MRVCDIPARLRPREELDRRGAASLSDAMLLAVVLGSGTRGINVVDLAQGLMRHYGSLTALSEAPLNELCRFRGIGRVKAQILQAALQIGRNMCGEQLPAGHAVRTPQDVARIMADRARPLDAETFWCLLLDAKNRLKCRPLEVTRGLLDASLVHPREVFRDAVRSAAAAVVLAHNHPSGDPAPSAEDLRITRQLVEAGRIMDIKVLDHVVLGRAADGEQPAFTSLRESGLVSFS
jgi:DNA repair protein RadC